MPLLISHFWSYAPGPGRSLIAFFSCLLPPIVISLPSLPNFGEIVYVPGPGAYDQKWEISKGTYILSTHKNQVVHKFPPSSYTRFPKLNLDNLPSPGSYNIDKGFLKNSEVLSTVKSPGSTKFTSSSREFMNVQNENPGPGAYRLPSDFGHYESPRKNLD